MPVIQTADLKPNSLDSSANLQTYCGLDCCLTLEILEELKATHGRGQAGSNSSHNIIYDFERAMQGPYLEIMQRGFKVDDLGRRQAAAILHERRNKLQLQLDELSRAIWDKGLNPRSHLQLKQFFYEAMKLPEVWLSQKGERKLSTNREALEKLDQYMYARPFVRSILAIREIGKQLDVFESDIDSDSRFRTSYNIAGTESGRPSSSENAFGTGGNAQNIAPSLRYVFEVDLGFKLCVIDLEQVEARDVGFFCGCLFDDWTFLDACESGDLHTNNAKLIWPELEWTGDPGKDKEIASRQFYRDFSFRDMAKRGGHLSNYYGTAYTMGRSLKIPIAIADEFQARYVRGREADHKRGLPAITPAYSCIPEWWQWTAQQLQTTHQLVTPFGRRRHFFGRPGDDTTLREAIAYMPQSTTADRMNLGLWRVWHAMPQIQLLAQTYDSITFQFEETANADEIIEEVLALLRVELVAPNGRKYVVPGEAKVGWNWGYQVLPTDIEKALAKGLRPPRLNIAGLSKWKKGQKDTRTRPMNGLQRIMI